MNPHIAIIQPQQLSTHCQSGFFYSPELLTPSFSVKQSQGTVSFQYVQRVFLSPTNHVMCWLKKLWWHEVQAAWWVGQGSPAVCSRPPFQPLSLHSPADPALTAVLSTVPPNVTCFHLSLGIRVSSSDFSSPTCSQESCFLRRFP